MSYLLSLRLVADVSLGLVFLFSAWPKLRYPRSFMVTVLQYELLPPEMGKLWSLVLPVMELLTAVLFLSSSLYYVTEGCFFSSGALDCYYVYSTGTGCPNVPIGSTLGSR